jgi:hypothetical protein
MSYAEHAIRALILHDWKDAREWASALTALSDVTDAQLDERVRLAIVSPPERVRGFPTFEKAKSRFRR